MATYGRFFWSPCAHDPFEAARVLAWDGRIDNRADLQSRTRARSDEDGGDAAVVREKYQTWGVAGLARVIGDWSVVIHDPAHDTLLLASDYMGVRPLYYHVGPAGVQWSTELRPLVTMTGIDALDQTYIAGYLLLGRCPHRTPYAGIFSVPPGHAVCIKRDQITIKRFWSLPTHDAIRYTDHRRYDEEFRGLFREAVAVRLDSAAPAIAELSGGLDSSSVVCMANGLIRAGAVATRDLATVSFVHRGSQDLQYIRDVERHCGLTGTHLSVHQTPIVSPEDVGDAAPDSWSPVYKSVAAIASRLGARTILTGQGGDLVAGNWFDDSLQVAAPLRVLRFGVACREALNWSQSLGVPMPLILTRAIRALLPVGLSARGLYSAGGFSPTGSRETSLAAGFARGFTWEPEQFFSSDWTQALPERRKHFLALTMMRELRVLQRHEAAPDCDLTHPFAHRPLVEFLMSVPADVLCRPDEPRRLMRRSMGGLWPPSLRARRSKSLFGAPWFEALKPLVHELLNTPSCHVVHRGWIDAGSLKSRLQRLLHGLECNEGQLRHIVLLECWLRRRERGDHAYGGLRTA